MSKNLFFTNLKARDIPDQLSEEFAPFMLEERDKALNGFYVVTEQNVRVKYNGLLYWLTNHWNIPQDKMTGVYSERPAQPMLATDNLWLQTQAIDEAEVTKEGVQIFGIRRGSKSTLESGYVARSACLLQGTHNLIAGSSSEDLENLKTYITDGLYHMWEGFAHNQNTKDWNKGIELGSKEKDGTSNVWSKIYVRNFSEGRKTQVIAGATPSTLILDEVGKSEFLKVLTAAFPALRRPDGKFRCVPILVGTGGEADKAKDAKKVFYNPKSFCFRSFKIPNETKEGGLFIGQKYRFDAKVPGSINDLIRDEDRLSIEEPVSDRVKKLAKEFKGLPQYRVEGRTIPVLMSNAERAKQLTESEVNGYLEANEPELAIQTESYYPTQSKQCFEKLVDNPYAKFKKELQAHQQFLIDNFDVLTTCVRLRRDERNKVVHKIVKDKPLFELDKTKVKSQLDAPICVYDFPKNTEYWYLHVAGVDPYHVDGQAMSSQSIGSIYIFRRTSNIPDPFSNAMVASYSARPEEIERWYENVEMLLEWYGCKALHEYTNVSFYKHFDNNFKTEYVLTVENLMKITNVKKSRVTTNVGVAPTPANRTWSREAEMRYLTEKIQVGLELDGTPILERGLTRIMDPMLIEEYLNYTEDGNFDRISAFRWTCAAHEYCNKFHSSIKTRNYNKILEELQRKQKKKVDSFVGVKSIMSNLNSPKEKQTFSEPSKSGFKRSTYNGFGKKR